MANESRKRYVQADGSASSESGKTLTSSTGRGAGGGSKTYEGRDDERKKNEAGDGGTRTFEGLDGDRRKYEGKDIEQKTYVERMIDVLPSEFEKSRPPLMYRLVTRAEAGQRRSRAAQSKVYRSRVFTCGVFIKPISRSVVEWDD